MLQAGLSPNFEGLETVRFKNLLRKQLVSPRMPPAYLPAGYNVAL